MKYVQIVAAVLAGYVLLRLAGRVHRLELVTGAWRVQESQVDRLWYGSWEFDEALQRWERELRDEAT